MLSLNKCNIERSRDVLMYQTIKVFSTALELTLQL